VFNKQRVTSKGIRLAESLSTSLSLSFSLSHTLTYARELIQTHNITIMIDVRRKLEIVN
jgi:hypothetical protein